MIFTPEMREAFADLNTRLSAAQRSMVVTPGGMRKGRGSFGVESVTRAYRGGELSTLNGLWTRLDGHWHHNG